jgi:16S rRNA (guanine527-N7)-methyltransferase
LGFRRSSATLDTLFHVKAEGPPVAAAAKLDGLIERYQLGERQRAQLEEILLALAADERAPTTVRDAARAADIHLADSLVALEVKAISSAKRIADLGAGAGFPGLALAVALPAAELCLVESQARKCAFIEGLLARAGVSNVRVVGARAEEWEEGIGANDVVLARALAAPAVVIEYAAPLLRLGGALVEWRGRREPDGERSGLAAARQLGLGLVEIRRVEPYEGARDHHLHVYLKDRETPSGFPRRAGMARKRPLFRGAAPDGDRR